MNQAAKKISVFSFVIFFVFPAILATYNPPPVGASDLTVLASQHKYAPDREGGEDEIARLSGTIKQEFSRTKRAKGGSAKSSRVFPGANRLQKKLSAKSAVILDSRSGQVIYEYDADNPRQPASTIKILTGLLAIEKLNNKDRVIPSRRAARMPRSKIYLKPGSTYQANDLINAVLLASANDASVALAEKIAGSETKFAAMMTLKAELLGACNTVCKTASGLTKSGQCSTARDLAVVFNQAMQNREFARRMKHTKVTTSYGKTLWNHNKALWRISGALGGKTGYTRAARQTYVGKFEKKGEELVVAIMGSESMWDDITRLVRYGFSEQAERRKFQPAEESVEAQLARLKFQLHYEDSAQLNGIQVLSEINKSAPNLSL